MSDHQSQSTDPRPVGTPERTLPDAKHIAAAVEMARCSPCRSKRGVAIFRPGSCRISTGYNFKPRGFDCDGSEACKATCRQEAIHAEQFALLRAGHLASGAELLHVKVTDAGIVPSGGPSCVQCSKLILASGIVGVWLFHEDGWRRYEAHEFHRLSLLAQVDASAAQIATLTEQLAEANELHAIQLAAVSTASIQNTRDSWNDGIGRDNPYWTVAYGDVRAAVFREIESRERADAAESALTTLRTLAEQFVDYWTKKPHRPNGGCGMCGGTPHTTTCYVGRFAALLRAGAPTEDQR